MGMKEAAYYYASNTLLGSWRQNELTVQVLPVGLFCLFWGLKQILNLNMEAALLPFCINELKSVCILVPIMSSLKHSCYG